MPRLPPPKELLHRIQNNEHVQRTGTFRRTAAAALDSNPNYEATDIAATCSMVLFEISSVPTPISLLQTAVDCPTAWSCAMPQSIQMTERTPKRTDIINGSKHHKAELNLVLYCQPKSNQPGRRQLYGDPVPRVPPGGGCVSHWIMSATEKPRTERETMST
jgi:hypothetical protein